MAFSLKIKAKMVSFLVWLQAKKLGNAVERNRAKRRTREAIRTGGLIDSLQGVQFILILKKNSLESTIY